MSRTVSMCHGDPDAGIQKPQRKRKKCPHGREPHRCQECGGASRCQHGREPHHCKGCLEELYLGRTVSQASTGMQGKVVVVQTVKHQILYADGSIGHLSTPQLKRELNPTTDELKAPKPKPKPKLKHLLGDTWHEPKRTATAVSLMSQAKGPGRATLGNADSAGFGNFQVLDANPAYAKLDGLSSSKFICGYDDPGVADLYDHIKTALGDHPVQHSAAYCWVSSAVQEEEDCCSLQLWQVHK